MPKIVHFEIPADDTERAKKFYSELFGWKIEPFENSSEYWLITTEEDDGIGGGMMKRRDPRQSIVNYIDIPSVESYLEKILELGGTVIVPKMPVPGMGYYAVCRDTEKNVFGLWETDPNAAVLRDSAEVFAAILLAVIASDDRYSIDEMRTVWYEVEQMDIFKNKDFKVLETQVLSCFDKKASELTAFSEEQVEMILSSAKNLLSAREQEKAFETALKIAYADRSIDGYLLMEADEREQTLLGRIRKTFNISEQKVKDIILEIQRKNI